jgi:hypothetical protein
MSNQYKWVISQLECYPEHSGLSDVVFSIHWRRQATDSIHSAEIYGSQSIALSNETSFTPYADLTLNQVVNWLESAMGADKIAELNALLDKRIEETKNPVIARPALPWA